MVKALLILPALFILGDASAPSNFTAQICADRLGRPTPGARGQPIAVLVRTNPWAMLIGGESPRLALYDDGLVIYQRGEDYRHVRLGAREAEALRNALGIGTLACFVGHYGDTAISDQGEDNLFIGRGGPMSLVSVYGDGGSALPWQVGQALERLSSFDHPDSRPWLPERIEIVVWPYENAPDRSVQWPSDWPDLNSETTRRRPTGYSIFLPSSEFQRLVALLGERPERGAIEINGRKWAVSPRFPFPREAVWMSAYRE